MKKKIDTLVEDIYSKINVLSEGKDLNLSKELLDSFGVEMARALEHWSTPHTQAKNTLRMSNVGKPLRRLWYDINEDTEPEEISPSLQIKFLYGHLLEVLLLFFVRLAEHKVTDEQKEIKVSGVLGHMDCKIDDEVIDIKTASGYSFKKFKDGTLGQNDSFGYLSQLAGYEEAEKTNNGGFLVMNKETGELTTFIPEDLDKPNIKDKIKKVKAALKKKTPPVRCYSTVPEGASGNMKLPMNCVYCPHKFKCHADSNEGKGLRVFKYAKGNVYFTEIKNMPNVEEVL